MAPPFQQLMYMLPKFILLLKKEDMIGNIKWHKESAININIDILDNANVLVPYIDGTSEYPYS